MKIHLKNTSQLTDFINNTSRLTLLAIDYQPLQSSMIEDSSIHRGFRISRGLPDHPYRFRFTNNVGNSSNSAHGCVVYEYVKPLYTLKGSDCLGSFRILALPRRTLIVIPNTVSQHALNQHFLGWVHVPILHHNDNTNLYTCYFTTQRLFEGATIWL